MPVACEKVSVRDKTGGIDRLGWRGALAPTRGTCEQHEGDCSHKASERGDEDAPEAMWRDTKDVSHDDPQQRDNHHAQDRAQTPAHHRFLNRA